MLLLKKMKNNFKKIEKYTNEMKQKIYAKDLFFIELNNKVITYNL